MVKFSVYLNRRVFVMDYFLNGKKVLYLDLCFFFFFFFACVALLDLNPGPTEPG